MACLGYHGLVVKLGFSHHLIRVTLSVLFPVLTAVARLQQLSVPRDDWPQS